MSKHIVNSAAGRAQLLAGINKLADAVACTLGPGGRLVVIERDMGIPPFATKDGVTVAREITLPDPIENIGARMVREAASRTVQTVGDGTTTATVIARSLIAGACKLMDEEGVSPQRIRRELETGCAAAIEAIRAMAQPCLGHHIAQVATISANGDEEIGRLVAEAVTAVGREGVVTVDESIDHETSVHITNGLQFDSGWLWADFAMVKPNPRLELTLSSPKGVLVLVTDQELRFIGDWQPILEYLVYRRMPLLVMAEEYSDECIGTMLENNRRGNPPVCAIRIPKERRAVAHSLVEDITAATGAPFIREGSGWTTQKIMQGGPEKGYRYFGVVESAVISRESTVLRAMPERAEALASHAERLRSLIDTTEGPAAKEALRRRLARLVAGVATIKVGAPTESEMRERKDLFEDAVFAARAAVFGGIVPGGGVALLDAVPSFSLAERGYALLMDAMREPAGTILRNAGFEGGLTGTFGQGFGVDIRAGMQGPEGCVVIDMIEAGIIDPANVVIEALRNAVSIACVILSTESVVSIIPEVER